MTLLVSVALALAVLQTVPTRFDLDCTGTQETILGGTRPWQDRLRVDLLANLYCWRNCTVRADIYKVADGVIVFQNAAGTTSVNRVTGEFSSIERVGNDYLTIKGQCVRREFTPITDRMF